MSNIISPQIRAARALLGITAQKLADLSKVSVATIRRFEADPSRRPFEANLATIQSALEAAGIVFIPDGAEGGPGVRLAAKPDRYAGLPFKVFEVSDPETGKPFRWGVVRLDPNDSAWTRCAVVTFPRHDEARSTEQVMQDYTDFMAEHPRLLLDAAFARLEGRRKPRHPGAIEYWYVYQPENVIPGVPEYLQRLLLDWRGDDVTLRDWSDALPAQQFCAFAGIDWAAYDDAP